MNYISIIIIRDDVQRMTLSKKVVSQCQLSKVYIY